MGVISVIVKRTAENISKMSPGTMVTHVALREMLEAQNDRQYRARVSSLIKALKNESGLFLQNERSIGYKIAYPGDEINVCEARCNRGKNIFISGVKDMSKIDIARITDKEKLAKTVQTSQKQANLAMMLKSGVVQPLINTTKAG